MKSFCKYDAKLMIKILLDPQIFNLQKFGGISRYYTEIYSSLKDEEKVEIKCPLLYTDNIHFKGSSLFKNSFQAKMIFFIRWNKIFRNFSPRKLLKKTEEKTLAILDKKEVNLFIPTYYDPYFMPYIKNTPFVLTVYDMIHELYPQHFTNDTITVPNKKLLIEKATKIIAISESTKKDILDVYPNIDAKKIDVVYLAHTITTDPSVAIDVPKEYILFVGNRALYKNFIFFLKSAAQILIDKPTLYIFCAGGNEFTEEEKLLIDHLALTDRVIQKNFKDSELENYYKHAKCFVFPSEYEGFGIPVLEAMACGCPVVLANHSSFPEVAGKAGIYFNLKDESDLREKITALLNDEKMRQDYSKRGLTQAAKFTWKKTAEESLKIYQSVL